MRFDLIATGTDLIAKRIDSCWEFIASKGCGGKERFSGKD